MMHSNRRSLRRRRGSLTVEMIMVVTVLAIVTVGIVQFGVFFGNADEVAFAARVGGEEASQTFNLPTTPGPVPDSIISAIEHQLRSSQIDWSHIRLEHNVTPGDAAVDLDSDTGGGFAVTPKTNLPAPPAADTHYVRLTVAVPRAEVFPRSLSFFGHQLFPLTSSYEHTVVFRYELTTP
jgi:Flp pilus assembly protein TadG